ncbi:uncharacterized protein LOC119084311 isoform X1 [Bradysia coprophila]|uniref:uncharacterized protein LOC119084311 isoform X1 n=1 Tax=Bradysia coprophila TaxID=38358 RepID=UPI00187D9835|nr:uncharacterized protein LOC119084311 isoform X1 [Bradysia coprophila]XP_037050138.1 uncharacterized protein LOC119084311 isoform X1 [Bradysia coprophila]
MPKLNQPKSLEHNAICALVNFLCDLGKQLMPIIIALAKSEAQRSSDILEHRIRFVQKYFEYNIPCFLYDPLCDRIVIEIPKMIDRIKRELRPGSSMGEYLSQVNVAVSLTEVILSSNLKKLDCDSMPKVIRHLFYNKLNALTGLEYLNLGSLSGGWKTCDMEPTVLNGIVSMKYLQYFCLNYDCTNNILLALLDSCPKLTSIDITSSKSINNDSVNILLRFKQLKCVQLYRTSISIEGYVKLLLNLPRLEDVGRYDEIGRCLEYIVDNYPDKQIFALKKFSSRFVTTRFLQILAENCPDIYYVSLFHNVLMCDLMMLVGINNLSDLRLLSCDFFADQVRNVIAVKGCNLTHLHLEHVDEIDMNALMYISQFCPDLKALTFYNCEMLPSTSMFIKKPAIPPFMNMERLTLIAQCDARHLEFLLSSCFKIKYIKIGTMVPTDDLSFERILTRNPMVHLDELSISCSAGLSIATVYKLVESCQNLSVLNELEGWELIDEMELETFRLFIETNNFDLNIASKRFQVE